MFVEDVVLGGLKAQSWWFVSDHLLKKDATTGDVADLAREIADRNDLRYEQTRQGGVSGYKFWRIE